MDYIEIGDISDFECGIFAVANEDINYQFSATHGECADYCSYYHRVSGSRAYIARSCTETVSTSYSSSISFCSSFVVEEGESFGITTRTGGGACTSQHYSAGGNSTCPLGWGTYRSYQSYSSGCSYGRYYPNPEPAHSGLHPCIGSSA